MRLIDAEYLLDLIKDINGERYGYVDAEDINNAPTVDAVPVKHGHWIWSDDLCEYCCSRCGHTDDYGIHPDIEYCPYCGAKMDESTQSNDFNTLDALGEKVTE